MRTVAAGVVLLLVAISGCSSDEAAPAEVAPLASESGAGSPSTSARASSTGDNPRSVAAGRSPAQEAPGDDTPQGASAFTRFFFEQVNDAYLTGDTSRVVALSHPDCNSCKSITDDVERLGDAGLRVSGMRFRMDFVEAAPFDADLVLVDYRFDADAYVERRGDGSAARAIEARQDVLGQARLVRDPNGWLMFGLRLVGS